VSTNATNESDKSTSVAHAFFLFHRCPLSFSLLYFANGCTMISKTLRIPKA
jgi:hypothetical protein